MSSRADHRLLSTRGGTRRCDDLPVDAPGRVPWWPSPDVTLFAVMVHVLQDTSRHAGRADILREQLDGLTGTMPE
ncbi:hypothetical protein L083_4649 [Actinoplanes sp. N902-109]|nr:hypothetical protein L083_4649 [Actinoplanes sp. N902-109]